MEPLRLISAAGPAATIADLIAPTLGELGYGLVRVQISGTHRPVVQIMIERQDHEAVTVEDCSAASRQISALLDVADPLPGAWTLEVSSPGIDRPLTRADDFDRFAGFDARIELAMALEGRKRFTGRLAGRDGEVVMLEIEEEETPRAIPLDRIARAKLLLTDALIAAAQSGRVGS